MGVPETITPGLFLSLVVSLCVCWLCAPGAYAVSIPSWSFALVNLNVTKR